MLKGKPFPFRPCVQILVLAALLGLGALVLLPLWRMADAGLAGIRDGLIGRLELELGREVRFSSISPSIFGAFDIRNVRIAAEGEDPVLAVSRFRVTYSFVDLLLGRVPAVRSVRLDSPVIDFDLVRDRDILDRFGGGDGWNFRDIVAELPDGLTLQVRNGKFIVRNGDDRLQMDAFNLASGVDGSRINLDARWGVSLNAANPIGAPVGLELSMRLNGSGCADSGKAEGVFSVPFVRGDAVSSSPLNFALVLADGVFGLRKAPGAFPFDASLEYVFADGTMNARLDLRNFRPDEMFSFRGGLEALDRILDVAVVGEASLRRGPLGELEYAINLAGVTDSYGPNPARGMTFELDASGDENEILVRALRLYLPDGGDPDARFFGGLGFVGNVALNPPVPEGTLSLDGFGMAGMRNVNAVIAVRADYDEITLRTDALRFGDDGRATLGAAIRPFGENVDFEASLVLAGGGVPGSALLRGSMVRDPRLLDLTLAVNSFPVRNVAEMALAMNDSLALPVGGLLYDTVVSAEFSFSTDFDRIWYSSPSVSFSGGGFRGTLAFSGTESGLELERGRVVWRDETLLLSGRADFASGTGAPGGGFLLNLGYRNLNYHVQGAFLGNAVVVRGSNGLDVGLIATEGGGRSGHVRAENFPIPFLGHPALLSVNANLNFGGRDSWSVALERLELTDLAGPAGLSRLRVSGRANETGADFPVLLFEDPVGRLSGGASVSWPADFSGFTGSLTANHGAERYAVEGSFADGNLELALYGYSMQLSRFSGRFRTVVASGDLRLTRDRAGSLNALANLSSLRGRIGPRDLNISGRAELDDSELRIGDVRATFAGLVATVPELSVSRADGVALGSVELGGTFSDRPVVGAADLDAVFSPPDSWRNAGDALEAFSGAARVRGFAYGADAETQDFDFVFSREDRVVAVSGGPRNMLRFRMDRNDNIFLALSSPSPIRGSVIGTVRDNQINARGNDLLIDLAGVFGLMPKTDGFLVTDGYATASVDIRGSLRDPEFYGQARGTGVRLQVPHFIAQDMRPVPFTAVFDGDEIRIGPVPVAVGTGAGVVRARFNFDRWVPNIFSIDIDVPRETPVPFDVNLTGFTARGGAAGRFNVSMEDRVFDFSGNLWANNTVMGVNTDEIGGGDSGEPAFSGAGTPFRANVSVTTGPAMEFFYPSTYFPLVRATPEMGTRIDVAADSLAGRFSVNGDVRIRRGEIFYFQRNFYIRSGLLTLRESERRFDPRITARAELRDRTADGPVTVSMIVDNEPLASFTARFESSPTLSQVEIFSLLGQSFVAGQDVSDVDPMQTLITSTTDIFAQFTLVREIEARARNFLRMDMFSIRTQALQNAFFLETGLMQPQVDITGRLGNYFDNTTIFMGRYFGQDMFFHSMVSMHYDAASLSGLTIQPNFGFELQGPRIGLGDLRIRGDFGMTSLGSLADWTITDPSVSFIFDWLR